MSNPQMKRMKMNSVSSSEHCHYVVPRKKRRCRMLIKPGNLYCGEHSHLLNTSTDEKSNEPSESKRIPCPLDPKHSCAESRLESHLLKCPSKQDCQPEYISKEINIPKQENDLDYLKTISISSVSDQELLDVIEKVDKIYQNQVKNIAFEVLKHPLIEEEIAKEHIGNAASKHLVQNSSLLGHLERLGTFEKSDANVIEFGSGRGQMTYWMAKASKSEAKQKFILVDKASHRHKFDNKLKDDNSLNISRIRADIQDLVLDQIPQIKDTPGSVIGVSKHLCGAATDLAMRCLATFSSSENAQSKIETILIALCCHHRCDWNIYVGKEFLIENGLKPQDFPLLCGLTSWATCGTGKPREKKSPEKEVKKEENPHVDRYDKLNLPRDVREEIGRKTKRIIDMGRCDYVKKILQIPNVKMAFYVDSSYTLENVVLIATTATSVAEDKN